MRINRKYLKPKKCSVTGKTIFLTEQDANRAMFRVWSHDTSANIYDLHVYPCGTHFHFGHKSYYEKVRVRFDTETIQTP